MEALNHMSCLSQASSPTRCVPDSKCPIHEVYTYICYGFYNNIAKNSRSNCEQQNALFNQQLIEKPAPDQLWLGGRGLSIILDPTLKYCKKWTVHLCLNLYRTPRWWISSWLGHYMSGWLNRCRSFKLYPLVKFLIPGWGDKVYSRIGLSYRPTIIGRPVGQPYAEVNYIPHSGTMKLATVLY